MTDPTTDILASFSSAAAGSGREGRTRDRLRALASRAGVRFVWKPGLVVTADEALAEEGDVSILLADGTARPASIVGRDHPTDIALLRFDAKEITSAKLSPSAPALGSLAIVVAAARGTPSAALGVVSLGRRPLGAACAAATSMRRSNSMSACITASKAGCARCLREGHRMAVLGPRRVLVIPTATIERVAGRLGDPRPHRARLSRGRLAGRQVRRRRRCDGDERHKSGPSRRRRHQARRRHRRLEQRKSSPGVGRCCVRSGQTASARWSSYRCGVAVSQCGSN